MSRAGRDLGKPLGATTLFATLGYRWYGDPPGIELRDVPYFAVGATYRLGEDTAVGLAYDDRPHIVDGGLSISGGQPLAMVAALCARMEAAALRHRRLVGRAAPDAGVGSFLEYQL